MRGRNREERGEGEWRSELGFGEGEEKFLGAFDFYQKFLGIGVLIFTIVENSLFLAEFLFSVSF